MHQPLPHFISFSHGDTCHLGSGVLHCDPVRHEVEVSLAPCDWCVDVLEVRVQDLLRQAQPAALVVLAVLLQ